MDRFVPSHVIMEIRGFEDSPPPLFLLLISQSPQQKPLSLLLTSTYERSKWVKAMIKDERELMLGLYIYMCRSSEERPMKYI